jgi:hypothetical protein
VAPVHPSFGSKLAFYAALLPVLGMLFAYPFFGFLWTFIAPVVLLGGLGIGPLAHAAFAPAICPACDRRFLPQPSEERLPEAAPATMLRS